MSADQPQSSTPTIITVTGDSSYIASKLGDGTEPLSAPVRVGVHAQRGSLIAALSGDVAATNAAAPDRVPVTAMRGSLGAIVTAGQEDSEGLGFIGYGGVNATSVRPVAQGSVDAVKNQLAAEYRSAITTASAALAAGNPAIARAIATLSPDARAALAGLPSEQTVRAGLDAMTRITHGVQVSGEASATGSFTQPIAGMEVAPRLQGAVRFGDEPARAYSVGLGVGEGLRALPQPLLTAGPSDPQRLVVANPSAALPKGAWGVYADWATHHVGADASLPDAVTRSRVRTVSGSLVAAVADGFTVGLHASRSNGLSRGFDLSQIVPEALAARVGHGLPDTPKDVTKVGISASIRF